MITILNCKLQSKRADQFSYKIIAPKSFFFAYSLNVSVLNYKQEMEQKSVNNMEQRKSCGRLENEDRDKLLYDA
jgi:hypothetical protein